MTDNPKDLIGAKKVPLSLFPANAIAYGALAMLDGARKYGRQNFRAAPVRASVYIDALLRHIYKYAEGETIDPESGLNHLAHVLAGAAILVDTGIQGTLIDDRLYNGDAQANALRHLDVFVQLIQERGRPTPSPVDYSRLIAPETTGAPCA